jgi:hypothetical protein
VTDVLVPTARFARWVENFGARHGSFSLGVSSGALMGTAEDGSSFRAAPPFGQEYDGPPDVASYLLTCEPPRRWGVLLVRKGGFAIARLRAAEIVESKVGQRHVQGRTKAGGQSQQRFARRRDNQARVAYEAAAEHAARILELVDVVVAGGDHTAIEAVLADRRLARLTVVPPFLATPDPRRSVLEQAITDAGSVVVTVVNVE